ncbi:MAG: hemerythrin domain-containing protein [Flavobacteriaceae bacterium]
MNTLRNRTLAEIMIWNSSSATVFKRYGLDYIRFHDNSLESTCKLREDINLEEICLALEKAAQDQDQYLKLISSRKLDFMIDYVVNIHHVYLKETIPALLDRTNIIYAKHKRSYPKLKHLKNQILDLFKNLMRDMHLEERKLYPAYRSLLNEGEVHSCFGDIKNPTEVVAASHKQQILAIDKLKSLCQQIQKNKDTNNDELTLFCIEVHEFIYYLGRHMHLESNYIFPKALKLA